MERRRLAAARDLLRGMTKARVARKHRVAYVTVWRWETGLESGGLKALRRRKATGRPPKLSLGQLRRLGGILERGARFSGGSPRMWTSQTVACLIRGVFRVGYHRNHIPRVLRRLRLRLVRPGPKRRPILRD
jgi:transposase